MTRVVYVNGRYLPYAQAGVHVEDRGFQFADAIYEVCEVNHGKLVDETRHMERLERSLGELRIAMPMSRAALGLVLREVIRRNRVRTGLVYLQVTRGADTKRNHAFPGPEVKPTVFLMSEALVTPSAEQLASGIAAVSAADIRWLRCDLKTVSMLANCLLRQHAIDQGCMETVLFRDSFLTEGAASSIFVCKDGVLLVPPKSHLMLPGITYDVVLELAAREGLPHVVRPVTEGELRSADEIWITSSTKEILAITRLDGQAIGNGGPGAGHRHMVALQKNYKHTVMRGRASP